MKQETLYIILIIVVALTTLLPMVVSFVNARRNQKVMQEQMQKREEYLASLKAGDEVLLFSGIHGKIVSIKDSLVELQIAQSAIIYVEKDGIMGKARELLFK